MRSKRMLILAAVELAIAVAFATASALVLLYERDDVWLQLVLVFGGIAGLLNGAYLLKLRNRQPSRGRTRPPGAPKTRR
ncbi:hypothetical protein [Paenibacillus sp. GYB003]|uniref:hypothetical protein n=1 Tax=Paenibacillus sp. GYB003 TaxID=2994392 RepID=UPI002F96DAE1